MEPLVSIITPVYNSEEYLEECIKGMMSQTYRDFEHIIVDGGSKDGTLEIIKKYEGKYPMRWISEKDNGMYDAISKGFKMAKGDVFCWINSDDMYMPWTLATINKVINKEVNGHKVQWCVGLGSRYTEDGINMSLVKAFRFFHINLFVKAGTMDLNWDVCNKNQVFGVEHCMNLLVVLIPILNSLVILICGSVLRKRSDCIASIPLFLVLEFTKDRSQAIGWHT